MKTLILAWQRVVASSVLPMNQGPWAGRPRGSLQAAWLVVLFYLAMSGVRAAEGAAGLHPRLEGLRPLLGKTWKGEFKGSTPEKPVVDVARWERALNGQAVRVLHSINQGAYGGESLLRWNDEKKAIEFHYFTTAGFVTSGTMVVEGRRWVTRETVSGSTEGITEVRGEHEIRADGTLFVKTEYLKNGTWVPGREVVYREDPKAEVIFR